ncbi:hypothetical protein DL98DRAFT_519534 [Cadophora sp. DSE1049]|nr:hypothetical protein DL98DRAFT_519534 [Cadophora sp. DSE1049]
MSTPTFTQQLDPAQLPSPQPADLLTGAQTEFHLFSSLPLEIRLRIYTLSLPNPRLIPLVYIPPSTLIVASQQHQHQQHNQSVIPSLLPPLHITQSTIRTPKFSPPSLLHTTHGSRAFSLALYIPCLPLCGLPCPPQQTLYLPTHDIVYFPSLASPLPLPLSTFNRDSNLNASFTNFASIHTLAIPLSLMFVRRLAVSEDVFLGVEKGRWRRRGIAYAHAHGGRTSSTSELVMRRELEKGTSTVSSEGSGCVGLLGGTNGGSGKGGIDAITVSNVADFWDVVRRKFQGLEEVWIVGDGTEGRLFEEANMDVCESSRGHTFDERDCERRDGDKNGMTRERRMSFKGKIERAVSRLEEETGWTAPRWRYMGCEEGDFSSSAFEIAEERDCLGGHVLAHTL